MSIRAEFASDTAELENKASRPFFHHIISCSTRNVLGISRWRCIKRSCIPKLFDGVGNKTRHMEFKRKIILFTRRAKNYFMDFSKKLDMLFNFCTVLLCVFATSFVKKWLQRRLLFAV